MDNESVQPVATVTGLYRGKFGGLEPLTVDTPLTRDEVRRNPILYELDLHPEQEDKNLIIDVIYDNMSPLRLQDLYRGTDIPGGVRFWPDWFDIPPYMDMRDVDGRRVIAVNEKRSSQISAQSGNRIPDRAPMTYSTCCKTAETSPDSPSPAVNKDQPRSIRPGDYKKLEIPEPKTPCYYCGKKGTRYIEKYTKERRARPRDQQEARRICRSCYDEVVKAEQTASVPLPGIVDVSRCTRVTVDVGKCSVCGVAKAVWLDRETGVKLCEQCYGRGVREEAREAGLV